MSRKLSVCLFAAAVLVVACVPLLLAQKNEPPQAIKTQQYTGKVVPLSGLLEKFGANLDKDAASSWLALVTEDGKVYPLIKEAGSRMFFKDARLLNRPMRLTGRLLPETHLLQVLQVHSLQKGALHEVYYWCEVCTIRRSEPDICECCGGPMELREPAVNHR